VRRACRMPGCEGTVAGLGSGRQVTAVPRPDKPNISAVCQRSYFPDEGNNLDGKVRTVATGAYWSSGCVDGRIELLPGHVSRCHSIVILGSATSVRGTPGRWDRRAQHCPPDPQLLRRAPRWSSTMPPRRTSAGRRHDAHPSVTPGSHVRSQVQCPDAAAVLPGDQPAGGVRGRGCSRPGTSGPGRSSGWRRPSARAIQFVHEHLKQP
jgi:hypothetical protein